MGAWTCEACGGAVPQSEGETTAAAVRRHARSTGHPPSSVRRERPGGVTQRWRTPEDREQEHRRLHRADTADQKEPGSRPERDPASDRVDGKSRQTTIVARTLSSLRDSVVLQSLVAAVLALALGTLAVTSLNEAENVPSSGAASEGSSVPFASDPADPLLLSDLTGGTWGDARDAMKDSLDKGEVRVLDRATGLPLTFASGGDPQRDKWTVCSAALTRGALDAPGWRVTVEIASPHHTCYGDANGPDVTPPDQYDEGTDTPTSEAEDDTASGSHNTPGRGVRPGSWCGDPGSYGYTSAGTRMQCRYGAGSDHRWRRAS